MIDITLLYVVRDASFVCILIYRGDNDLPRNINKEVLLETCRPFDSPQIISTMQYALHVKAFFRYKCLYYILIAD